MNTTPPTVESMEQLAAMVPDEAPRRMTIWSTREHRTLATRVMEAGEQTPYRGGYVQPGGLWYRVEAVKSTERGPFVEVGRAQRHDPRKPPAGIAAHTLRNRKRRKARR